MDVICKLEQVDKIYTSAAGDVHALKQVSCEIREGEFVVLAGPSGSGKTTLANILGFLDGVSAGNYVFKGKESSTLDSDARTLLRRQYVGFVFQSFNLIPILTAKENVALATEIQGMSTEQSHEKALALLDLVGMSEYAERYPNELSGGQQQRISIARALVKEPAILIADEPTASLDSHNTQDIIHLMMDLNKTLNSICIVCTHDERVISVAPRLLYVKDGNVEQTHSHY